MKVRDEAYRLHLLGLSQQQISDHLKISQGQVSRHIDAARKGRLWTGKKPVRDRCNILLQTLYDRLEVWYQEAARVYLSPEIPIEEKVGRSRVLQGVFASLSAMKGFAPDAEALQFQEQLDEVEAAVAEGRLAKRVLLGGRKVSAESSP